jgi:hypothetical protein
MRLVIEEAKDHTECMDNLRARYGADCVVVHSFKTDDRYRVIIALEAPSSLRSPAPRDLPMTNMMTQPKSLRSTFWLEDDHDGPTPAKSEAFRSASPADTFWETAHSTLNNATPNTGSLDSNALKSDSIPAEITAELLALAARVKALESAQISQNLAPEPQAAQSMLFSDVLKDTVGEGEKANSTHTSLSAGVPTRSKDALNTATSSPFAASEGEANQKIQRALGATSSGNKHLPLPLSNVSLADEARSFNSASQGASSFVALLTDHLASSQSRHFTPQLEMTAGDH